MNWLERWERLTCKHRRLVIRRNVRAYRQRQERGGVRRIDVALSARHYEILCREMTPNETFSAAIGRILDAISGKRE